MKSWAQKQSGFTIVELLVVIVVIGILAAITVVAYNGVQNLAKESAAQASISQIGKKLAVYALDNIDQYPVDKASFLAVTGVTETSDISYEYLVSSNRKSFCASTTNQGASYAYSSSSSGAVKGKCIKNWAGNPSASGSTMAYFGAAGSTHAASNKAIATDRAHHGNSAVKAIVSGTGQMSIMAKPTAGLRVNAGETLSWSYWVYSTKAGSASTIVEGSRVSDGSYTIGSYNISIPANTWTKVNRTWTATVDTNVSQAGLYNLQVVSGDIVWFDEATIQKSSLLYQYADGDSSGGFWEGGVNNSSSVAPVLPD